jgi:hypothetical protein
MPLERAQEQAVVTVLDAVLTATRPEERILIDAYMHPESKPAKDSILSFGIESELALLLPSVLIFLKDIAEGAAKKVGENIGEKLSCLFAQGKKSVAFNPDALKFIGDALASRLLREGFEAGEAQRAGDSLIAVLVANPKLARDMVVR